MGVLLGKRGTFLNWLCVSAVLAVFSVVLYRGLVSTWRETGLPPVANQYLRWEKQHMPSWFVNLFRD